jgi:hypothetical protein
VLKRDDFEFGLTIAALPLSMLLLVEGHLAAKYENKWMMGSFLVGMVAGFAYFSYKVCDPRYLGGLCISQRLVHSAGYHYHEPYGG